MRRGGPRIDLEDFQNAVRAASELAGLEKLKAFEKLLA